jgi:aspartyl-tRNA(Asn)/glutamyl-tRNA(Gln) amidotransferase subunit C
MNSVFPQRRPRRERKIDVAEARRIAALARLELDEHELARVADELDAILGYVAQLEELALEGVPGTSHALDLACPLRDDEERPSSPRAELLAHAPAHDEEFFLVPRVIGAE